MSFTNKLLKSTAAVSLSVGLFSCVSTETLEPDGKTAKLSDEINIYLFLCEHCSFFLQCKYTIFKLNYK